MKKQIGKNLMQKWKNKIRVRLSALDKKKLVLTNIPYILTAFYTNRASFLYRNSLGEDIGNKLLYAMEHADRILTGLQPSFNWRDMLTGIVAAVILKLLVWQKQSDAKKLRKGIEYGSARWGNAEDIKPYMSEDPWMNIPLTATEALTMESRPKQPKYARNKNIVVIGGSGSGKTRFFVKPSVMQMNCSMVITDPKGTLIEECGKMLAKGPPKKDKNGNIMKDKSGKVVHEPYVIKVLNTINFSKSLHYNPFAYIRSEKDILKLVTTIIVNTKGEGEKASEDFWVKAEKLLYTALIAFIWYEGDEEEKNLNTLLDLLNESETREEDETYQNPVDMMFQELEERDPQHFAVRQYKKYKMAAGKTAKSILISCGARLAPFDIAELREIMSYDEMELDKDRDFVYDSKSKLTFGGQVNFWLNKIMGYQVKAREIEKTEFIQVLYRNEKVLFEMRPKNVGTGVTYITELIIAALACKEGDLLIIENPEIHLHPSGQSELVEFLAFLAQCGVQIIVETHSDHIYNGIRKSIRLDQIDSDKVNIYSFTQDTKGCSIPIKIPVNGDGKALNNAEGFFDQIDKDLNVILGW